MKISHHDSPPRSAAEPKCAKSRQTEIRGVAPRGIGNPFVAVDLTGTIDGVIRHDHILKTADALLNKSPGAVDPPLSDTDMADNVPLLSPVEEE